MERNQTTAEVLNDLVLINNDRMEGYSKAIDETKAEDSDLKLIFEKNKLESFQNRRDLVTMVEELGEKKAEGTRMDGKIYRAWMDLKATFSGNSRKSILENCEFGEDAAQKAYKSALAETDITADARQLISQQQASLKSAHDSIKRMRDSIK